MVYLLSVAWSTAKSSFAVSFINSNGVRVKGLIVNSDKHASE